MAGDGLTLALEITLTKLECSQLTAALCDLLNIAGRNGEGG
jgi:hypothetical protein